MTDAERDHYWALAEESLEMWPKPGRRRYRQNPRRLYYRPGEGALVAEEFHRLIRNDEERAEAEARAWAEAKKAAIRARAEARAANAAPNDEEKGRRHIWAAGGAIYCATLITLIGALSGTAQAILLVGGATSVVIGLVAFIATADKWQKDGGVNESYDGGFSGYTTATEAGSHRSSDPFDNPFAFVAGVILFPLWPVLALGIMVYLFIEATKEWRETGHFNMGGPSMTYAKKTPYPASIAQMNRAIDSGNIAVSNDMTSRGGV